MNKEQMQKLNLADGFVFGTFQKFSKALGKKSNKPYGRIGILIGNTVHVTRLARPAASENLCSIAVTHAKRRWVPSLISTF